MSIAIAPARLLFEKVGFTAGVREHAPRFKAELVNNRAISVGDRSRRLQSMAILHAAKTETFAGGEILARSASEGIGCGPRWRFGLV